jgi:hypothetical protein
MIEKLRQFLQSGAGKGVAVGVVAIGLIMAFMSLRGVMTSEAEQASANRMFIDAETGKPFRFTLDVDTKIPTRAPSGKDSGYPAEACFWTKDGKTKTEPTWVLINMWKGSSEPTFCPDCDRLVVGHNPQPAAGVSPPPTKEEYSKGNRGSGRRR